MEEPIETRGRDERSFGRRAIDKQRALEWYQAQEKLALFADMLAAARKP